MCGGGGTGAGGVVHVAFGDGGCASLASQVTRDVCALCVCVCVCVCVCLCVRTYVRTYIGIDRRGGDYDLYQDATKCVLRVFTNLSRTLLAWRRSFSRTALVPGSSQSSSALEQQLFKDTSKLVREFYYVETGG